MAQGLEGLDELLGVLHEGVDDIPTLLLAVESTDRMTAKSSALARE